MEAKGRIVKMMIMKNACISLLGPWDALDRLVLGKFASGAWTTVGLGRSRLCRSVMEFWSWVVLGRVVLGFGVVVVFCK